MTIRDLMRAARRELVDAGIETGEAALDAELLARHVLGWSRATLLARDLEAPPPTFGPAFGRFLARRARREPLAYIRGVQEFWGRDFQVSGAVLIPRPETEMIVEWALRLLGVSGPADTPPVGSPSPRIVDIGTGSGCLAVTLALECPTARVVATDVSAAALEVAGANAARWGVAERITWMHAPYLGGVLAPVDLIVTNPPYVADGEATALPPEVREYEPATALFAGADGLRDIREILHRAADRLTPTGALVMEIGVGQADAVRGLVMATDGLALERVCADLQGIARTVVCRRR